MPPLCIGIGGMSRSGKSALAGRLSSAWSGRTVSVLSMDDFCYPERALPHWKDEQGELHRDWEHPSSVDYKRLIAAVETTQQSCDVVIVEGILIFHDPELFKRFDQRVLLEIDKGTFLDRRRADRRWGTPKTSYLEHVWNAYAENKKGLNLENVNVFRSSNPSDMAYAFLVR